MLELVNATDLMHWADRRASHGQMPELVRRLIHATTTKTRNLSMPIGDCIWLSGYDGVVDSDNDGMFLPSGRTIFEIGTEKDVKGKANRDYNTRVKKIPLEERRCVNFVFVTPRLWNDSRKWQDEKNKEGNWLSVKVITGVELEDWISMCPTVAVWLAEKIGKINSQFKIESLESFWRKWSENDKGLVLKDSILIGGREKEYDSFLNYLQCPVELHIESTSTEESLAFAVACILKSGDNTLIDRCIIANGERSITDLIECYQNIIIITDCASRKFGYAVGQKSISIIYATNSSESGHNGTKIELPCHDYYKFLTALEESGLDSTNAKRELKDSGRSVAVLRHRLNFDSTIPQWAKRDDLQKIIPIMLLCRWSVSCNGDKELLEELCHMPYEEVEQLLAKWKQLDSTPFSNIGDCWYVHSPLDTFLIIRKYITNSLYERYCKVLFKALNDQDSNALSHLENLAFYSVAKRKYSDYIRSGLCASLVLFALYAEGKQTDVDLKVREFLNGTDIGWWLTYKRGNYIQMLAEASPESYLRYIEKSLGESDSIIKKLFVPQMKSGLFGNYWAVYYIQILRGIELLAWMPEYLLRASLVLIELSDIQNESYYSQKPKQVLIEIYRPWFARTQVGTKERCRALKALYKHHPCATMKICYGIIDDWKQKSWSQFSPTTMWRLREMSTDCNFNPNEADVYEVFSTILQLVSQENNLPSEESVKLLSLALDCTINFKLRFLVRKLLISHLSELKSQKIFYRTLLRQINKFRCLKNEESQIPESELMELEELLVDVTPENVFDRLVFLFEDNFHSFPEIIEIEDIELKYKKVQEMRVKGITEILRHTSLDDFISYSLSSKDPDAIFRALALCDGADNYFYKLFDVAKSNENHSQHIRGFFMEMAYKNRTAYMSCLPLLHEDEFIWYPLCAIRAERDVWEMVKKLNAQQQRDYWSHADRYSVNNENVVFLISKFIGANNVKQVISILFHILHFKKEFVPDLVLFVTTLQTILPEIEKDTWKAVNYELSEILGWIDSQKGISDDEILSLEFPYVMGFQRDISTWRVYRLLLNNPHRMFEMINCAYFSEDPQLREKEKVNATYDTNYKKMAEFSGWFLMEIHTTPCTNKDGSINEEELIDYIDTLQKLGMAKKKTGMVNQVIGKLLANHPDCIVGNPPIPICEIIENQSNADINMGFRLRIYNQHGVSSRKQYQGGMIERKRAEPFKKAYNALHYEYPVISSIYLELFKIYSGEAIREDIDTEMRILDS